MSDVISNVAKHFKNINIYKYLNVSIENPIPSLKEVNKNAVMNLSRHNENIKKVYQVYLYVDGKSNFF